jgi:hypothetical protein
MNNIKLLTGTIMSLQSALVDINNLNDCINKRCWQEMIEDLIKDVTETIKIEKSKTNN